MRKLMDYLSSSALSYVFVLILLALLIGFDQGSVLIVDVLNRPLNLILFLIIFNTFTLVLAHYPTYLHKFRNDDYLRSLKVTGQLAEWQMSNFSLFGLGLITYRPKHEHGVETIMFKMVRKFTGVVWHVAFFYILLETYQKYFNENLWSGILALVLGLSVFALMWVLMTQKEKDNVVKPWALTWSMIIFYSAAILACVVLYLSFQGGWSKATFFSLLGLEILFIVGFGLFTSIRSSYTPRQTALLHWVANHEHYLLIMSMVGWISFVVIFLSHFSPHQVSPLVIVLAYFYFFYGVFVIPIKHHFYYSRNELQSKKWWKYVFYFLVKIFPFLFLIWIVFSSNRGNNLHLLPTTKIQGELVNEGSFIDSLNARIDTIKPVYFMASYGGGLKANAWNLLLMEHWRNNDLWNDRIHQSVAMSGVSGGALGQAFYGSILKNHNSDSIQLIIDQLSETNFLSIDLTYLLGYDLIRELTIGQGEYRPDRAQRAFEEYARVIHDEEMNQVDFQSYWAELWHDELDHHAFFPALIVNSTGTHQKQGVASSVVLDDFSSVFPGADNLLDFDSDQSLSYGHVVSCANRFPIFSPAAKIGGKGHYVDGGYFENSGLLSLLHFYRHLRQDSLFAKRKVHFNIIINDKRAFVQEVVRKGLAEELVKKESESGEIKAILNSLVSLSIWPDYLRDYLKTEAEGMVIHEYYLPFHLSVDDLEGAIMGKLVDKDQIQSVDSLFERVNERIDLAICDRFDIEKSQIGWHAIEPPLGRILTKPAVNYMRAMIQHDLYDIDVLLKN